MAVRGSADTTATADVAVIGGGPAGAAAALTLLAYSSLRVAVIERSHYEGVRIGETVSPAIRSLLDYLGIPGDMLAAQHVPMYGTHAAWGSPALSRRDFLTTGHGDGWHLDRLRFDRLLADAVRERGGTLYTGTRLSAVHREQADSWTLGLVQRDHGECALTANYVIDATGQQAGFARRIGAIPVVCDQLIGIARYYDLAGAPQREWVTLVESVPNGWWYSACLPGDRMIATFMSDPGELRQRRARTIEGWEELLAGTQYTRQRLAGARLGATFAIRPAAIRILSPVTGSGWIAAGDAAAAFDPLASMGIGHGLSSGMHAARVAHDWLTADGLLSAQYERNLRRLFAQHLQLRHRYYLLEQRWAQQPFWARRHIAPVLNLPDDGASLAHTRGVPSPRQA
jgi:flavin-dependent dehydrogenase